MIKLKAGYDEYSADNLAHLGETVAANLPGIPVFGSLVPGAADIAAAATALRSAIAMIGPGRAQAIKAAFEQLAKLLADVAVNAPQVKGVTDTELAEIGLPTLKARVRETSPPPAPGNLRLEHGEMPGNVRGKCAPAGRNIRCYESQYTLDPNGQNWTDGGRFPNSQAFYWKGLERGKDTWFRVAAVNTIGQGPWSDPATIMPT